MKVLRLFALLVGLGASTAACGQEQPQLVWEGEVDGAAVIYVRGIKLTVEIPGGGAPLQREGYRFFQPLPDSRQNVDVRVFEGRGEVRVIQQPNLENKYTLAVQIDDRQDGPGFYSLRFYWEPGAQPFRDPFQKRKKALPSVGTITLPGLIWSGRVEDRVRVVVQGRQARAETASGQPAGGFARFERSLPARATSQVTLHTRRGRGTAAIVEYPSAKNGYRLVFEISPAGRDADDYEVEVAW